MFRFEPSSQKSKRKRFLDKVPTTDYNLAEHSVRVRRSGAVCDVLSWWNVQQGGSLRGGGGGGSSVNGAEGNVDDDDDNNENSRRDTRLGRTISVNAFNEVISSNSYSIYNLGFVLLL